MSSLDAQSYAQDARRSSLPVPIAVRPRSIGSSSRNGLTSLPGAHRLDHGLRRLEDQRWQVLADTIGIYDSRPVLAG
jgi:hypothetical protein